MSNVPDIRFKGFTDAWEQRKLGDIKDVRDGTHDSPKYYDKGYPLITSKNLKEWGLDLSEVNYISKEDYISFNKRSQVNIGDILFGMIGTIGNPVLIVEEKFAIKNVALIKENVNFPNIFLIQMLKSPLFNRFIQIENAGGTQKFISLSKIRGFKLFTPSLEEQMKIGKILRDADKTITLLQRKIDNLKKVKKGLLQKLFPLEQSINPQVRFSGFNQDWEQREFFESIDRIIDFRGKTPKKLGLNWSNEGYLALSALNVKNGYIDLSVEANYGDESLYSKWMGNNKLEKGQVLFTTEAPMGNIARVPDNKGYILSQRTISFVTKQSKLIDEFLYVLLGTQSVKTSLNSMSSGGTAKGISQRSLKNLYVIVPSSIEEQKKIGDTIILIEDTITLLQKEVEMNKQIKKGFLQKLFPKE